MRWWSLCEVFFSIVSHARCSGSLPSTTARFSVQQNALNILFTPRYISVSSKHVLSLFDDGNRVTFPITPAVECSGSPAVSGGAVTQQPFRATSNSRLHELIKMVLIKRVVS